MKEEKNETRWDRLLANSGLIRKENTLLDYGCGKGRVDFLCHIRPDANPSVLNIMSTFGKVINVWES